MKKEKNIIKVQRYESPAACCYSVRLVTNFVYVTGR